MIRTFDDLAGATAALADRIVAVAAAAIAARGAFRIALSGGSTPRALYSILAAPAWAARIDWPRVVVLFADERAVSPDDPESTFGLVRRTLVEPLGARAPSVRRMAGEAPDLDAAARDYESELATPLDLALLGIGPDGHTASLFPRGRALDATERRVVAVLDSPKPPPRRITLTPRTLGEAREAAVLCGGADKAAAVARALAVGTDPRECPAALLAHRDWYLDRAAAGSLTRR